MAVGYGANTIAYSNDGVTWTGIGTGIFTTRGNYVAWNGTRWVATGYGSKSIVYSTDGQNWFDCTSSGGGGSTNIFTEANTVDWTGILWLATGSGTNTIAYSNDGITWTGIGTSIFSVYGISVYGYGYSYDTSYLFSDVCYATGWDGTTNWVACGSDLSGTGTQLAYSSDNGLTWKRSLSKPFSNYSLNVIYDGGSRWISCGDGTTNIAYSNNNGVTWSTSGIITPFTTSVNAISKNYVALSTNYVAVGIGGTTVAYSTNGTIWNAASGSLFTSFGQNVYSDSTKYVAVGGGTRTIIYSLDGQNWTDCSASGGGGSISIFSNRGNGIYKNGNAWISAGNGVGNTLAYSSDGITWSGLGLVYSNTGLGGTSVVTQSTMIESGGNVLTICKDDVHNCLFIGGYFTKTAGLIVNNIVRWNIATNTWSLLTDSGTLITGVDNVVSSSIYIPVNNSLYIGGGFTTAGGNYSPYIARWDISTSTWNPVKDVLDLSINNTALCFCFDASTNLLYIGGDFTSAGSLSANRIATWNIATNQWGLLLDSDTGVNGTNSFVNSIILDSVNKILYIGGNFTSAGGKSANRIVKYDLTTSEFLSIGSGVDSEIISLLYTNNTLYFGGNMTTTGGDVSINNIGKIFFPN